MSDTTYNDVTELDENEAPTSYSSSSPAPATNRPAIKAPGAGDELYLSCANGSKWPISTRAPSPQWSKTGSGLS